MDTAGQVERLNELNRAFYERTCESFSATRQSAWRGWNELWKVIDATLEERAHGVGKLRIADIACGNLRFVRFLEQRTKVPLEIYAFDGCEPLLMEGLRSFSEADSRRINVREKVCDIATALSENRDFLVTPDMCDLTVVFGFMHHLPLVQQRERLLRLMTQYTIGGGFIAASFWQFADDVRLHEKAQAATLCAQKAGLVDELDEGDYLLGWRDDARALRFCHHCSEDEIDMLSASLVDVATEVIRFSADGKSGELNRYVVWRRHG